MRTPRITTERLLLREIQPNDIRAVFDCWMQDEEVSRYMWWKASSDISDAEEFVCFELDNINSDKWKRWIITLKETEEIAGTCLVFYNEDDELPHWDISYNLGRNYWGRGYITEAMTAVMSYAGTALGMKECITTYAKINSASARVLHKLGFVDVAGVEYECSGGEIITEGIVCRYHEQ